MLFLVLVSEKINDGIIQLWHEWPCREAGRPYASLHRQIAPQSLPLYEVSFRHHQTVSSFCRLALPSWHSDQSLRSFLCGSRQLSTHNGLHLMPAVIGTEVSGRNISCHYSTPTFKYNGAPIAWYNSKRGLFLSASRSIYFFGRIAREGLSI